MMLYDVLRMMFYVLRAFLVFLCRSVPQEFLRSFLFHFKWICSEMGIYFWDTGFVIKDNLVPKSKYLFGTLALRYIFGRHLLYYLKDKGGNWWCKRGTHCSFKLFAASATPPNDRGHPGWRLAQIQMKMKIQIQIQT